MIERIYNLSMALRKWLTALNLFNIAIYARSGILMISRPRNTIPSLEDHARNKTSQLLWPEIPNIIEKKHSMKGVTDNFF